LFLRRIIIYFPSESENLEATAQFDFNARSERELSFKKGDTLTLYTQVSNDWWRGALAGREGLIPDKYIMLKIKLVLSFFVVKIHNKNLTLLSYILFKEFIKVIVQLLNH